MFPCEQVVSRKVIKPAFVTLAFVFLSLSSISIKTRKLGQLSFFLNIPNVFYTHKYGEENFGKQMSIISHISLINS